MKRMVLFWLLFWFTVAYSTSYVKFYENGLEKTGHAFLTQGNAVAWEADVSRIGGVVQFFFYEDLDSSLTISGGDRLLDFFWMQDGVLGTEGPGDSSETPDGIIYVDIGPLGFLPGNFILRAIDEDGSEAAIPFHVTPVTQPIQINGRVVITGESTPSSVYQGIVFGGISDPFQGFWMAATDSYGNYTLQHPQADAVIVSQLFDYAIGKKVIKTDTEYVYTPSLTNNADTVPDFQFFKGNAKVYGKVYDQYGSLLSGFHRLRIENLNKNIEKSWYFDGQNDFELYMYCEGINNVIIRLEEDLAMTDILVPDPWNNPMYQFNLNDGDTLKRDITVYKADTAIYVKIYENGSELLTRDYILNAYADTLRAYNNILTSEHFTRVPVYSREGIYNIIIAQWDEFQLPPDYVVIPEVAYASPGDTITFHVYQPDGMISGIINLNNSTYAPSPYEYYIYVKDVNNSLIYKKQLTDINGFSFPLPNGSYKIWMEHYTHNPQSNRFLIQNPVMDTVTINNDTINVQIGLIEATNEVVVRMRNVTVSQSFNYSVYEVNHPEIDAGFVTVTDTSFSYFLAPGDWFFEAPQIPGFGGTVDPQDTVLNVTLDSYLYTLDFIYSPPVKIDDEKKTFTYKLHQNYPNPFNPETRIEFEIPSMQKVSLIIYNALGEEVMRVIDNKLLPAGHYKNTVRMEHMPSGVYFYKLITQERVFTKKLILLK